MNRRSYLKYLAAALSATPLLSCGLGNTSTNKMRTRVIPSSGEQLPVVGVGTWQTFDVGPGEAERAPLKRVLELLIKFGGSVIDSSPMYNRSEQVVGDLAEKLSIADKLFMATKVWTSGKEAGIRQMQQSMERMGKSQMDLMQVHNLIDWKTHLDTLRKWKEEGRIRYIGITHYLDHAYSEMAGIIKSREIDFIQIDYSITNINANKMLLPLAKDSGVAVIINRPFNGGSLFDRVHGKSLPNWAKDYEIESWAQFFLKFILSNQNVSCVIPGTDKPEYMIDNAMAGIGPLPEEATRTRMFEYFKEI